MTQRRLKGKELLLRTRGWWTVEPREVAEVIEAHGRLVVGDKGELMVEVENHAMVEALSEALKKNFDDQVMLSP